MAKKTRNRNNFHLIILVVGVEDVDGKMKKSVSASYVTQLLLQVMRHSPSVDMIQRYGHRLLSLAEQGEMNIFKNRDSGARARKRDKMGQNQNQNPFTQEISICDSMSMLTDRPSVRQVSDISTK